MNARRSQIDRRLGLWVALVALVALMGACATQPVSSPPADSQQAPEQGLEQDAPPTPQFDVVEIGPDGQAAPGGREPRDQSDCPDLDSALLQIVQAPDPLGLAEQLQFRVKGSKIQVLLILDREDTGFLQDFAVEIGTQSGTQVQAFVPIDRLCDLANTDEVLAIRLPAQAVPQ